MRSRLSPLRERKELISPNRKIIISTEVAGQQLHPDVIVSFDTYMHKCKEWRSENPWIHISSKQPNRLKWAHQIDQRICPGFTTDRHTQNCPKSAGHKSRKIESGWYPEDHFGVSSTKRKQIPIYETNKKSTFDIKMEQETNLRLSGTIGEKIAVNLKYNSKQDEQLFDPNNINVKYTGDEDEVIRSIEAGNITLSLSGSRYISYSTSSQGLFGVTSKFSMAIWTIRNSIQRRRAEEHPNLRMDNLRQILQFFAAGITQPVRCTM